MPKGRDIEPLGIAKRPKGNAPRTWLGVRLRLNTGSHSQSRTRIKLGFVKGVHTQYSKWEKLKDKDSSTEDQLIRTRKATVFPYSR